MQLLSHCRFQDSGSRAHKLCFAKVASKSNHIGSLWQPNERKNGVGLSLDHISSNGSLRPAFGNHRAQPDITAAIDFRVRAAWMRHQLMQRKVNRLGNNATRQYRLELGA